LFVFPAFRVIYLGRVKLGGRGRVMVGRSFWKMPLPKKKGRRVGRGPGPSGGNTS